MEDINWIMEVVESKDSANPALAAIVDIPDRYDTVRHTMTHLQAQTVAEQIEIILVTPSYQQLQLDESELACFHENYRAYSYTGNRRIGRTDFVYEKAFSFPAVYADGTVVACDQDYNAQHPYGNLADGTSFANIWWSKRAAEVRKTIRDNPEQFSYCNNCPFKDRPISTCDIQYYDLQEQ
ncbi:SPASM domain-containing protein [Chloroflexota bacterium]